MTFSPAEPGRRTLLRGGSILTPTSTNDSAGPAATALCIEGDRISYVGPDAGLGPYADGADETVELGGRLVTPAFVDAHVHTSQTGLRLDGLDLSDASDRQDVLDALTAYARASSNAVLLGFGWDETRWPDPRLPSGEELDRAAPGRAVYLARVDVHSGLVSGALVARAPQMARVPGWDGTGRVERDAHHVARDAAQDLLTRSRRREALTTALDAAARAGIGCVHEMAAPHVNAADDLTLLDELAAVGRPMVEVIRYWGEHVAAGGLARAGALGCAGAAGDLCVDGAFGSRTAALDAEYADRPGHTGHRYLDATQIAAHLVACTRAGIQGGFHCIGDAATRTVVEGLQLAEKTLYSDEAGTAGAAGKLAGADQLIRARHRLEHVELVAPDLLPVLAAYGVVVSGQPAFDAAWGGTDEMYAHRLGAGRALATNPWAGLLRAGVRLAFGSDTPVTPFDPWGGVRAAAYHHEESSRITVEQAFEAHTRGGWHAAGPGLPPGVRGVLAEGADASLAVWDVQARGLPDLTPGRPLPTCVRTVVAGRTVHDLENATAESSP